MPRLEANADAFEEINRAYNLLAEHFPRAVLLAAFEAATCYIYSVGQKFTVTAESEPSAFTGLARSFVITEEIREAASLVSMCLEAMRKVGENDPETLGMILRTQRDSAKLMRGRLEGEPNGE